MSPGLESQVERFPAVSLAQLLVWVELAELGECALVFVYILTHWYYMCWSSAFHIEAPYESVKHQHAQEVWIWAVIVLFFLKMLTITKAGKLKIAPILPNCYSHKPLICFEGHKETAM